MFSWPSDFKQLNTYYFKTQISFFSHQHQNTHKAWLEVLKFCSLVIVIYTVSLCFFIAVLHATSAVNIYNSLWRPFVICLAAYIYTIGLFFLWGLTCSQKNPPEHVCSNKSQPLLILCYHDVGSQFTPFWHVYAIIRNTFQVFFSCYWSLYLISSNRLHEYAAIRAVLNSYKCIGQLQSWLMQLWRWHPAWRINQKTILARLLLFML